MGKFIDLTGQRFGRLIVIKRVENNKNNKVQWLCKCNCGNITYLSTSALTTGNTKSCGCLKHEGKSNLKHGKTKTRLYHIWNGMKQRCFNPKTIKYHNYGGRGIIVCESWQKDFMSFYEWAICNGYDENKSRKQQVLDRIDNNGNYEPNNCRWITQSENCRNRNNNILLTKNGVSKTIAEWCEELNLNQRTVSDRAKKYNDINEILSHENLERKKHLSNTGEFGITQSKVKGKYILIINHKYIGSFQSLEEAIAKREEILNGDR